MNHLLVTIVYKPPGIDPCMTTTVVPVGNQSGLTIYKNEIYQQYRNKQHYDVTITEV